MGYYNQRTDKTNSFQMIVVDRSDAAAGAFDIVFNYTNVEWETTRAVELILDPWSGWPDHRSGRVAGSRCRQGMRSSLVCPALPHGFSGRACAAVDGLRR